MICNPFDTVNWKILKNNFDYIPKTWFKNAGLNKTDFDGPKEYISKMMEYAVAKDRKSMVSRWVSDAFDFFGFEEDKPLEESDLLKISDYIAKRAVAYQTGKSITIKKHEGTISA